MLSSLSMMTTGNSEKAAKIDVDEMEFKFGAGLTRHLNNVRGGDELDSDDDEDEDDGKNPLKVLAEGPVPKVKKEKPIEEVKSLIHPGDIELHSVQLAKKADRIEGKDRFMPFHSLKHTEVPDKSSIKLKKSERSQKVDLNDLMPLPDTKGGKAKMMSIEESLNIQKEIAERQKQTQLKFAMERLSDMKDKTSGEGVTDVIRDKMEYRSQNHEEEEEEHDEENDEKGIGFTYSEYQQE